MHNFWCNAKAEESSFTLKEAVFSQLAIEYMLMQACEDFIYGNTTEEHCEYHSILPQYCYRSVHYPGIPLFLYL